ncbi:YolD-like family protein [Bacillus altitudinis]|uniref:YolD-like family protein n=1 Tax=Bacillus altitudinis TaxID=293387 RepID=UPI001F1B830A|nr:YolD-like family protein [Bacillus altitudinis]
MYTNIYIKQKFLKQIDKERVFCYYLIIQEGVIKCLETEVRLNGQAMMLPEHVARLKHDLAETKKIDKPIIDEQQAEEFESTIAYAMSVNKPLNFSIFDLGVVNQLKGFTQYINYEKKMLHIKDMSDDIHFVLLDDIVGVSYG